MNFKRCCLFLLSAALCTALLGCEAASPAPSPTPSQAASAAPAEPSAQPPQTAPAETPEPAQAQTATLYIGTRDSTFQEYPLSYEGELTPELLIQGIADLTGWDLTLAEPVTDGKGGMSVCLANSSTLFVGPPEPQKDEFHMYSAEQLAQTILDSIQKTLQEGFVAPPGDPDSLDIYFYMEGEQPLTLPNLDLSWPLDQPYQWPL